MTSRRIAYAYFDPVWDKSVHSTAQLVRTSVGPLEYQEEMKDHLICPQCYEPLNRIPSESSITIMTDGREALPPLPKSKCTFLFVKKRSYYRETLF